VIAGIDLRTYGTNKKNNELVLKHTIADTMFGVTVDNIINFVVKEGPLPPGYRVGASAGPDADGSIDSHKSFNSLLRPVHKAVDSVSRAVGYFAEQRRRLLTPSIEVVYTVSVKASQVSTATLKAQLVAAVETYEFDAMMHNNAIDHGAGELAYTSTLSVGDPATDDSSDDDSAALSTGAIIGIAVGGGGGLLVVGALVYYFSTTKKTSSVSVEG
jgi:hypothetical protein